MTSNQKRTAAAITGFAIVFSVVFFTTWNLRVDQWAPDVRFLVIMLAIGAAAFAASCPLFDD